MADRLLIYGANGYTGTLIARLAAEKKLEPILAGRDAEAVARLASSLGLPHRAFALTDRAAVDAGLDGISAVLHCAGPFSRTADPMVEACFRKHVHYLDITGELTVFESQAAKDAQARAAGVMLLSGAGLDIVPSDCLAAHLKSRLPGATHLTLGLDAAPWISRGTVKTLIESFYRGMVRENGRLVSVPAGLRTRTIDMGRGPVRGMAVPWGDVSTAYFSTGIPNIEVYISTPPGTAAVTWLMRRLAWMFELRPVQWLLKASARLRPAGPTEAQRQSGSMCVWGEAHDGTRVVTSRLHAPEGYTLTAHTALEIAGRVLRGDVKPGFQTPSSVYGADLILAIPGCTRSDEPAAPLRRGGDRQ
jgi:short subunit dehydrogenase-like uncharacterized protein